MVHVNKPAHTREGAFTDKTGGCNSKADVVERMCVVEPEITSKGTWAHREKQVVLSSLQNQSVNWYEKG